MSKPIARVAPHGSSHGVIISNAVAIYLPDRRLAEDIAHVINGATLGYQARCDERGTALQQLIIEAANYRDNGGSSKHLTDAIEAAVAVMARGEVQS